MMQTLVTMLRILLLVPCHAVLLLTLRLPVGLGMACGAASRCADGPRHGSSRTSFCYYLGLEAPLRPVHVEPHLPGAREGLSGKHMGVLQLQCA
jgi:hypothetical protein